MHLVEEMWVINSRRCWSCSAVETVPAVPVAMGTGTHVRMRLCRVLIARVAGGGRVRLGLPPAATGRQLQVAQQIRAPVSVQTHPPGSGTSGSARWCRT